MKYIKEITSMDKNAQRKAILKLGPPICYSYSTTFHALLNKDFNLTFFSEIFSIELIQINWSIYSFSCMK